MSTTTVTEDRPDGTEPGRRDWLYGGIALLIGAVVAWVINGSVLGWLFAIVLVTGVVLLYFRDRRARAELKEAKDEVEEMKVSLRDTEDKLEAANVDLGDTRGNLQRTRAKLGELIVEFDEATDEIAKLEAEITRLKEIIRGGNGNGRTIEKLEKELDRLRNSLEQSEEKLRIKKDDLEDARAEIVRLERQLEECCNTGGITIEMVDDPGDRDEVWVRLRNEGEEALNLGGCSLVDSNDRRFRGFPDEFELDAGDSETFEIEDGADIERTGSVKLYRDDEFIGPVHWRTPE